MPTPIDPKRVDKLRIALKKHDDHDLLDLNQLGKIYGVSSQRMSALIKNRIDGFPQPQFKENDKKHYYPAALAINSVIEYCENTGLKDRKKKTAVSKIMGGDELTASDIDRLTSAATKQWRLEVEMGQYITADSAKKNYRQIFSLIRDELTGWITATDPNSKIFDEKTRTKLEGNIKKTLLKLHDQIKDLEVNSSN